jgi:tRNA threonylcarbamoyladenosine biosynthesis protein TsaE
MNTDLVFFAAADDDEALYRAAGNILSKAEPWKIILLYGEMGAGKTTLVKAFCLHLKVACPASSPTFTLINQYPAAHDSIVYHMDMYRIEKPEEALQLGLNEYFEQDNWCFIEWPEKIKGFLPENCVSLTIESDPLHHDRTFTLFLP